MKLRGKLKPKTKFLPSPSLVAADAMADAMELFERTCIDVGKVFARQYRLTRAEADETVTQMFGVYVETVEELGTLIEDGEDDVIYALAAQEQTRRMIRGGVR